MIKSIINTKWGSAIIDSKGYYRLRKPYKGKPKVLIHRLIFEDCYKVTLLKNAVIHHKDHCTTNNNIENLELMSVGEHIAYHNSLRKQNTTQRINSSKNVGIKNVGKHKNKGVKQGYSWVYQYYNKRKRKKISSVNLRKLEEKVKEKGLIWVIMDKKKALLSYMESDYFNERKDNSNVLR